MRKEVRALLPLWAASVAVVAIAGLAFPQWTTTARFFYGTASIALAALSVGHEYVHGTLPALLTLPVSRARLVAMKLSALVPMLLTLWALAAMVLPAEPRFERNMAIPRLALGSAILLAPVLTMITRSPLAGVVFAAGLAAFMSQPGSAYFGVGVARLGLIALCAAALAGGWLAFMRLEAPDYQGNSLALPAWSRSAADTRSSARWPVWMLVRKEFRLQQMAFIVAAIHLVMGAAVSIPWSSVSEVRGVIGAISTIYSALLAILIGALAGAEERQMQTLDWQLLLPIAAWKQWTVKTAVASVVAGLLCLGIPAVLTSGDAVFSPVAIVLVFFFLASSLYIATLCNNVLTAMTLSPALIVLVMWVESWFGPSLLGGSWMSPAPGMRFLLASLAILLLGSALRFASENYRSGRDFGRVRWQLLWMAAVFAAFTALASA